MKIQYFERVYGVGDESDRDYGLDCPEGIEETSLDDVKELVWDMIMNFGIVKTVQLKAVQTKHRYSVMIFGIDDNKIQAALIVNGSKEYTEEEVEELAREIEF